MGTDLQSDVFPFGAVSRRRPPRVPTGETRVFVLGVYPSALHVRWILPAWAQQEFGRTHVSSLAVDVEPKVFWEGADPPASTLVQQWEKRYFPGDDPNTFGTVQPGHNGSSGFNVANEILAKFGWRLDDVWLTDASNRFYVKKGPGKKPGQADVIHTVYNPFAQQVGLPQASLPPRPTPAALVGTAVKEEGSRLVQEWLQATAPILITLGEEARQVAAALAEDSEGPPRQPLRSHDPQYGHPGRIAIAGHDARWMALTHPGNRSQTWTSARQAWQRWATTWTP